MKNTYLFLVLLLLFSCKKDRNDSINNMTIKWQITNPCGVLASNFPLIFHNNLAITAWSTAPEDENCAQAPIIAYNKNTGEEAWRWNEHIFDFSTFSPWSDMYVYENKLAIAPSNGGGLVYTIDLNTGVELWHLMPDQSGSTYVTGIGNDLFYYSTENFSKIGKINHINLETGEKELLLEFNYEGTEYVDRGHKALPYKDANGDIILFIGHSQFSYETVKSTIYLTLYNFTKKELISTEERQITNGGEAKTIHGDIFTHTIPTEEDLNLYLTRIDGNTYEPIWEKEANGGIGWSRILLTEDYLYHGSEQDIPKVYKRDINTGEIIWEAEGSGTSSLFSLYNNLLYFVGGGDGLLHIINTDTGETLLKLESPDYRSNRNAFFSEGISTDPETGRIYVGNYIGLICYEPYGQ